MESSECTLRLAICHLSQVENLLETGYTPGDSLAITSADSYHEQTASCGDNKGTENGYLSITTTSQDSGELKISFRTQLAPLDCLPCSEPKGDMNPLTASTDDKIDQEQGPQTLSLPLCESNVKKSIAQKHWRLAFLMIQIVRALAASIPARLKASTPLSPRAKPKAVRTVSRLPHFLTQSKSKDVADSNTKPILMFYHATFRPPFVNEIVWQKLEAHVRRKTSQRLWGFPNLVIKYVGDHVAQLPAGDGRPVQNAVKSRNPAAQTGLCLKRRREVSEKLQNLSKPARKEPATLDCNKQLAEHPEILRVAKGTTVLDSESQEVMSFKKRLESKLRRKFLEVKLSRIPGKVLQSYHAVPYVTKKEQTNLAWKQQRPFCKQRQRISLLSTKTLPFMSEEDLSRIEHNLKLKHYEHEQGSPTLYTLSLQKMMRIN